MSKQWRKESPASLAKRYEEQAQIQRVLVDRLPQIIRMLKALQAAFTDLFTDDHFTTLLRAEGLDRAPTILVDRIRKSKACPQETGDTAKKVRNRAKPPVLKISPTTKYELSRMLPSRRVEAIYLMRASGCCSSLYARALVGACPGSSLINPKSRPRRLVMKPTQKASANAEITLLGAKLIELSDFAPVDLMTLVVSAQFAGRILENRRVRDYLTRKWPAVAHQLENTVTSYCNSDMIHGIEVGILFPSFK